MKKSKIILIILTVIIIINCLGFTFYLIDNQRIQKNEKPIFVINTITYKDGGTKEYLGLGYKIIKYNTLGYLTEEGKIIDSKNNYEIGSWFLKYNNEYVDE